MSEDALTEIIGEGNFDMFEWGWVVEPDPNYQLSTFTCANRSYKDGGSVYANLSDSFYCDEEYDALYAKQAEQIDPDERAETVKAMQKMLYDRRAYVVTFYYDNLEAYRSDRFTGLPAAAGAGRVAAVPVRHLRATRAIRPVTEEDTKGGGANADAAAAEDEGGNAVASAVLAVALAALGVGGFLLARSRRRPEHDVE